MRNGGGRCGGSCKSEERVMCLALSRIHKTTRNVLLCGCNARRMCIFPPCGYFVLLLHELILCHFNARSKKVANRDIGRFIKKCIMEGREKSGEVNTKDRLKASQKRLGYGGDCNP